MNIKRVLVACECSGRVKSAFRERGFDAWSCDIQESEIPDDKYHIKDDVLKHLNDGWDLMIAHPDCTFIANSGGHWLHRQPGRWEKMVEAANFFKEVIGADIPAIGAENPIPHHYAVDIIGKDYDQIVQPYHFGEDASKATCLWLKGLPKLQKTKVIEPHYACRCGSADRFEYSLGKYGCPNCNGEHIARQVWSNQTASGQNKLAPSAHRKADRARTYQGIAEAMATQWGDYLLKERD